MDGHMGGDSLPLECKFPEDSITLNFSPVGPWSERWAWNKLAAQKYWSDVSCRFLRPQARRIHDQELNSSPHSAIGWLWGHDQSLPWASVSFQADSQKERILRVLSAPWGYAVQIFGVKSQKQGVRIVLMNTLFFKKWVLTLEEANHSYSGQWSKFTRFLL